tara:strand:- start:1283 stop:1426 length:144 start_codon:yes stop_codon:yes gene_type:complete
MLKKEILIIGVVNKIEIWNPKILNDLEKDNRNIDQSSYEDLADKIIL